MVASLVTERSQTASSTPRRLRPAAILSTVTALPRTDGNANGVRKATRDDIEIEDTGNPPRSPGPDIESALRKAASQI
jgi:hypothetical protein